MHSSSRTLVCALLLCALCFICSVVATTAETQKKPVHPGVNKNDPFTSIHSVYDVLKTHLPQEEFEQVRRILYGKSIEEIKVPSDVQSKADALNFEIKHYSMVKNSLEESRRTRRLVRIGVIQNQIVLPTDRPVEEQFIALRDRIGEIAKVAGEMGVNVLAMQEAWTMPFAYVESFAHFFWFLNGPCVQFTILFWRQ